MINNVEFQLLYGVDLTEIPEIAEGANASAGIDGVNKWATLGDLHANALKLINFLMTEGVVSMPEDAYEKFVDIYQACQIDRRPSLMEAYQAVKQVGGDLAAARKVAEAGMLEDEGKRVAAVKTFFREILPTITVTPIANIRALGDVLADRGANDILTLAIIDKLIDSGVKLEIILSNHDSLFIKWMEASLRNENVKAWELMAEGQAVSLKRIDELLRLKIISIDFLQNYFQKYKSILNLFSYDYNDKGQLLLHTHAHLDERDILEMANGLLEDFGDAIAENIKGPLEEVCKRLNQHPNEMISEEDAKALVDHLNAIVVSQGAQNNLTELIDLNKFMCTGEQKGGSNVDPKVNPLLFALWNRDDLDARPPSSRPKNPNIINVHGHHTYRNGQQYAVCMDNNFGKAGSSQHYQGHLTYVRSLPVNLLEIRYKQLLDLVQFMVARGNLTVEDQGQQTSMALIHSPNHGTVNTVCEQLIQCVAKIKKGEHLSVSADSINQTWNTIDQLIARERNPSVMKKVQREWNDRVTARSAGPKATTNQLIGQWSLQKEQQEHIVQHKRVM